MSQKTIVCFGDSNTWGYIPGSACERYPLDTRWPGVMQAALGSDYRVIEEAQNGRTTVWPDPCEPTVSKCGKDHLPVVLESHKPIDLVIVMLGTNDLKNHINQTAQTIAQGAITLVDMILASTAGPDQQAPQVLMVCPVPLHPAQCPFWHLFDGAAEKSLAMPTAYQELAEDRGVAFLNAGDHATCPDTDCIHLDAEGQGSLGKAMADKVQTVLP